MLHFCGLKDEQKEDWDYEGGNLPLLVEMVDNNGGYTLIPAHFRLKAEQMSGIKQIADLQAAPAREVLALTPNRSMKMQHIEAWFDKSNFFMGIKKPTKICWF